MLADLARDRIRSSITYLRVLGGESIPFRTYLRSTLGVEPRLFGDEQIRKQRGTVSDRLSQYYDLRFSSDEVIKFQTRLTVYNTDKLLKQFVRFRSTWVPILLEHIPVPLDQYKINVKFAEEDAYWKNWISGNLSEHEILLRINIHPRQSWYQGFPELLVIHEYCGHAIQMVNWHRRIEEQKLAEFCGILTVHFPDQFVLEGLAESLAFVLPDQKKLEGQSIVSRELHRYYLMVMNNVHIMANEGSLQRALDYGIVHLPFTRKDVLWKEIVDRTQNPLFRGYQYSYGIAKEAFLTALSNIGPESRWKFLAYVYDWPMTAQQFDRAAEAFTRESKGVGTS